MSSIRSISIVGTGNIAFHLGKALYAAGWTIEYIFGRNPTEGLRLSALLNARFTEKIAEVKSELIVLCVNDDAISELSKLIPVDRLVAHTSGSVPLEALGDRPLKAVVYPLQTFSKEKDTDFYKVPILLEASSETLMQQMTELFSSVSEKVLHVSSEDRKKVHVSAVFVNNFVNHLIFRSQELMIEQGLDWNILKPLIRETIEKLDFLDPLEAQTGPARRGDTQTIDEQSRLLDGVHREIYGLLTRSIMQTYGRP